MTDETGWVTAGLIVLGTAVAAVVIWIGYLLSILDRAARSSRRRHWEAYFALIERSQELEREQQRYIDWLYAQTSPRPRLTAIDGGNVVQFSPPPPKEPA
jgi:hypothetical protein